jgi:hypothetical protein
VETVSSERLVTATVVLACGCSLEHRVRLEHRRLFLHPGRFTACEDHGLQEIVKVRERR